MGSVPYIPSNAPFTAEQRAWINGYLAGVYSHAVPDEPAKRSEPLKPLLILFGSQTGTAEQLAKKLARQAQEKGFAPNVLEMNAAVSIDFSREKDLLIVTSTWGDGDLPDNAAAFWTFLQSNDKLDFSNLRFSVLALGDRNYASFCGAGIKLDDRLEKLGAKRFVPRQDCDTDYAAAAGEWISAVWSALNSEKSPGPVLSVASAEPKIESVPSGYNRQNPFKGLVIANRLLNKPGSSKETRHIEVSIEGSGLTYHAGDALGVWPTNGPELVDQIIHQLGCDGEEAIKTEDGTETSLRQALSSRYQINQISPEWLSLIAQQTGSAALHILVQDADKTAEYVRGRDLLDLFLDFPGIGINLSPQAWIQSLRKLQPRLYSIASGPAVHPSEIHATVGVVRYESHGRHRKGVCSTYLAEQTPSGSPCHVFVQPSSFRLPEEFSRPVIMIGPGTGIAPFRAFLHERRAKSGAGKNWLFFGDQCRGTDFLYEEEMQALVTEGTLHRLDTAFSRDQAEKIYVQHRMLEQSQLLWSWLEEGAHLYVCGDAKRMAKDVDAALRKVIERAGGKSAELATAYVDQMKTAKRYQRDVY